MKTQHSRRGGRLFATMLAVTLTGTLAFASQAWAVITPTSNATTLGAAMNATGGPVTAGSFQSAPVGSEGELPNATSDTALGGFPEAGSTDYGLMTSGDPLLASTSNTEEGSGLELGGEAVRGDTDRDVTILDLTLNVPATTNSCLKFDFRFLSEEYPEFVGSSFNDAFIAELDTSDWSTEGSEIIGTQNFARDPLGNPITINATGPVTVSAVNSAGTTYDAGTQRITAAHTLPSTAGTHHLFLSIFDQGDQSLDSAVFIDNVRVVNDASCTTGVAAAGTPPETPTVAGSVGSSSATFTWPGTGSFVCQIHDGPVTDEEKGEPFLPCTSPYIVDFNQPESLAAVGPKLNEGIHTLSVAAVNSSGDADQSPSTFEFFATPSGGGGGGGGGGAGAGGGAATPAPAPAAKKKCKKKGKKAAAAKKCKKKKKK
jgi:hypothetical protein